MLDSNFANPLTILCQPLAFLPNIGFMYLPPLWFYFHSHLLKWCRNITFFGLFGLFWFFLVNSRPNLIKIWYPWKYFGYYYTNTMFSTFNSVEKLSCLASLVHFDHFLLLLVNSKTCFGLNLTSKYHFWMFLYKFHVQCLQMVGKVVLLGLFDLFWPFLVAFGQF